MLLEYFDEPLGFILCSLDYRAIGVSVHNDEIVHPLILEVISTYTLKRKAAKIGDVGGRAA